MVTQITQKIVTEVAVQILVPDRRGKSVANKAATKVEVEWDPSVAGLKRARVITVTTSGL